MKLLSLFLLLIAAVVDRSMAESEFGRDAVESVLDMEEYVHFFIFVNLVGVSPILTTPHHSSSFYASITFQRTSRAGVDL